MVLHLQGDAMVSTGTGNLGSSVERRTFLKRNFVSCDNSFLWNFMVRGRRQHCFAMHHKFEKLDKLLDNIPYLKLAWGDGIVAWHISERCHSFDNWWWRPRRKAVLMWTVLLCIGISHYSTLFIGIYLPDVPQIHHYFHKSLMKNGFYCKCVNLSPFLSNMFMVAYMALRLRSRGKKLKYCFNTT